MATAKAIKNAITIKSFWKSPEGDKWIQVDMDGNTWKHVKKLPEALLFDGEIYGRRGWNSDNGTVSYCNRQLVATRV